jgi:hypothetical protein
MHQITARSNAARSFSDDYTRGPDALDCVGIRTPDDIVLNPRCLLATPELGKISLATMALALAEEVVRLQFAIDNVKAAVEDLT